MTDLQGLSAPFLISWLGVWLFAFVGGLASGFIKVKDIDDRLLKPFIAKPLIGTICGVALAIYINQNANPPPLTLLPWALIGAFISTPIVTGFLVFISDQKRQDAVYNKLKDKYLPGGKEDKS